MPDVVYSSIQMFADDAKLFREIKNQADCEELQKDLCGLQEWSKEWLLRFNVTKCKRMHLGRTNGKEAYHMSQRDEETALFETECEKDLGVYVDNELKFSGHCEKKVNQANKLLDLIRRSLRYLDGPSLVTIFKSEVLPHLEYCPRLVPEKC